MFKIQVKFQREHSEKSEIKFRREAFGRKFKWFIGFEKALITRI